MTCSGKDCRICADDRVFKRAIQSARTGSRVQIEKAIQNLIGWVCNLQFDNDYDRCILSGSWPGSVGILERALEKARIHEAEEEAREKAEDEARRLRYAAADKIREEEDNAAIARAVESGLILP